VCSKNISLIVVVYYPRLRGASPVKFYPHESLLFLWKQGFTLAQAGDEGTTPPSPPANAEVYEKIKETCLGWYDEFLAFVLFFHRRV